jgi:hypothetical protein
MAVACLVYLAFGSIGLKRVGWERWLASVAILVFIAVFALGFTATWSFQWVVALANTGVALGAIALMVFVIRQAISELSKDMSVVAAWALFLLYFVFLVSFPALLVFLATNGDSAALTLYSHASRKFTDGGWLALPEAFALLVIPGLLVVIPQFAHKALAWNDTPELTKNIITGGLATAAALLTVLFAFMLHFYGGPLAYVRLGPLAVVMLFVVALLVPIYRSFVRACWERGVLHIIDFARWWSDWRKVLKEWQAAVAALDSKQEAHSADSAEYKS